MTISRKLLKSRRALTFIELMTAVAVLATGILFVYKSFLSLLDYQTHLTYRLYAMNLLENEAAFIEEIYRFSHALPASENGRVQSVDLDNKDVDFYITFVMRPSREVDHLLGMVLDVSWKERGRTFHVNRSSYILEYQPES